MSESVFESQGREWQKSGLHTLVLREVATTEATSRVLDQLLPRLQTLEAQATQAQVRRVVVVSPRWVVRGIEWNGGK